MTVEALAYVDGVVVPFEQARVALADRGHLLGDGVFETMRVREGVVLHHDRHEARLTRGLRLLRAENALGETRAAIDSLLAARASHPTDQMVRLQVTTGISEEFAGEPGEAAVTAILRPLRAYPSRAYKEGITLTIAEYPKPHGPWSSVKTTSFFPHVEARRRAKAQGFDDAVFLNAAGTVCEATTSNVFAVIEGNIYVPGAGQDAVDGVQRSLLVEDYAQRGITVIEQLSAADFARADEVWLTNTVAGVLPVRAIEGRRLAGPTGRHYQAASQALAHAWTAAARRPVPA